MSNILIVDDEEDILAVLSDLLQLQNHNVRVVDTVEDGLAKIKEEQPDILVTDIIMPTITGLELIRLVSEAHPNIKIIAISGGGRGTPESYLSCAKTVGADKLFTKPFDIPKFIEVVDELSQS